ncbi:MAG: DNA helicase/exodeoxyribonuclease V alpha [Desulfobulbaceae bacterium]|nr:MAG: DNA helicase/exodeoxyribonuclease V alpha [Desulfobulbaceae bacterium]
MDEPIFSPLDHQFARFLTRRSGLPETETSAFEQLVKRLTASLADGHSCLPVSPDQELLLSKSPMVSTGLATPLILWHGRLYLQRYFHYESRLAAQLKALAERATPEMACHSQAALDACFGPIAPATPGDEAADHQQRRAAEMALSRSLALISGGPGTGKTSTVARILGLLLSTGTTDVQIALAAPTGKAAMRLRESLSAGLATLPFAEPIKARMPTTASTLHRLLGVRRHSPHFRHNHANPLPWDVVVVDEASMVDVAMMSKLVDALKPDARLILLGDKDQLTSVESGAVLADCIQALPDNTVTLRKSYRFNREISAFAQAINANDSAGAWGMIGGQEPKDRRQREDERREPEDSVMAEGLGSLELLREVMTDFIVSRYKCYIDAVPALAGEARGTDDIRKLFKALNRFRVLCATRKGAGGVETINRQVEQRLAADGQSIPGAHGTGSSLTGHWYPGRPVMILSNDYDLNLFNGDIGICLPDPAAPGTFAVWFEREEGSPASYLPYRLPACETVFAMTIHKSQGSEFDEVLVSLPPADSPLLTRELLYTAVTRARERVIIAGSQEIFEAAVSRNISRASGLNAMLCNG